MFPPGCVQKNAPIAWESTNLFLGSDKLERVNQFVYLGVAMDLRRPRSCMVDCTPRFSGTLQTLKNQSFTFNPKFGCPVWVGRMFARASYVPRAFFGMELGLTFGRRPDSGATVYHAFARSVLGTFRCTSSEKMLSFLGWPSYMTFMDMAFLRYFVRVVSCAPTPVARMAIIWLGSKESASSSLWWRSVIKAGRRIGVPLDGLQVDSENGFVSYAVKYAERTEMRLRELESELVPHRTVDEAGLYAADVFVFHRGFFNPRWDGEYQHIDCYMCQEDGGDTPSHVAMCQDDRVVRLRQRVANSIGWTEEEVVEFVTTRHDWRSLGRDVVQELAEFVHKLVDLRRKCRIRFIQAGL